MEREIEEKVRKSSKKNEESVAENKNLIYCITNMLGLICKINQNISELLDELSVKSNFSLSETFQIKNAAIENEINKKIEKFEKIEDKIIEKDD